MMKKYQEWIMTPAPPAVWVKRRKTAGVISKSLGVLGLLVAFVGGVLFESGVVLLIGCILLFAMLPALLIYEGLEASEHRDVLRLLEWDSELDSALISAELKSLFDSQGEYITREQLSVFRKRISAISSSPGNMRALKEIRNMRFGE